MNGRIVLNKHSKIPGGNIGMFIAHKNRECRINSPTAIVSPDGKYLFSDLFWPVVLFAGLLVSENPRQGKQIPEFKKSAQVFEAGATVEVILEDFDADGDVDALILNLGRSLILSNDGKGGFTEKWRFPIRHGCSAAGDIDSDGDVDLVGLLEEPNVFRIYLNNGRGVFENANRDFGDPFDFIQLIDFDRDGDLDVVASNPAQGGIVFANNGKGRFEKGLTTIPNDASFCDLNGDGFVDLVITNWNQPAQVWLNDGTGKFFDSGLRLGEPYACQGCAIKDLDNDGDRDIFITDYHQGRTSVWFSQLSEKRE
jgi:hypothetical protein